MRFMAWSFAGDANKKLVAEGGRMEDRQSEGEIGIRV